MRATQFITESALNDLERNLPDHKDYGHAAIHALVRKLANKHSIDAADLEKLYARKHNKSLASLAKSKINVREESVDEVPPEVQKFIDWSIGILNIQKPYPQFTLSQDSDEAQTNHHTGQNNPDENTIWVYVANRNLVDIFRTIFHELVHTRQGQLGMIKPGMSYPGSPIEAMADMLAGKYIKLYGEKHHEIFQ